MSMHTPSRWPGYAYPPFQSLPIHPRVGNPVWDPARRALTAGVVLLVMGAGLAGVNATCLGPRPLSGGPLTLATEFCVTFGGGLSVLAVLLPALYDVFRGRNTEGDVAWLAHTLADVLEMEVSLPLALERLSQDLGSRFSCRYSRMAAALVVMSEDVARGAPLSQSAQATGIFPPAWVSLCAAGERSGRLVESLRLLARDRGANPVIATRLLYVAALVVMSMLLALFLTVYIVPTFRSLLEGSNVPLPLPTKLLSDLTRSTGGSAILGLWTGMLGLVLLTVTAWLVRPGLVPAALARTPLFRWQRLLEQSRAIESAAGALRMGLSATEALEIGFLASTSPEVRQWLNQASTDANGDLRVALTRGPWVPQQPLAWLLEQGERFDNLPEALEAAAHYLREEGQRQCDRLLVFLDLGLTGVSGLMAGFIVYATMQPLALLVSLLERVITP